MKNKKQNWYPKIYYTFIIGLIIAIAIVFYLIYQTRTTQTKNPLDQYQNFSELKQDTTENKDWKISTKHRKSNNILITAIHGGGIEPGTTELARRISNIGNYDYYSFQGLLPNDNEKLHITSTNYDEPKLLKMLDDTKDTVSIHGLNGDDPIVYIGGKDKDMTSSINKELRKSGFTTKKGSESIDAKSSDNFVNENKTDSGVQLELTSKQRKLFFKNHQLDKQTRNNSNQYSKTFYKFAEAVNKGIKEAK